MPRESPAATTASGDLLAQQDALAAYIRDPEHVAPPAGIEERRLKVYRELFFNNVEGLLAGNFPVIRRIYGEARWRALVRAFYRDHGSRTPLFTEIAREFLRWLESRMANEEVLRPMDGPHESAQDVQYSDTESPPPWLCELAHYEWIELALQISEASDADVALALEIAGTEASQALLDGSPALSPLAWPLAYAWPVHRISPDYQPDAPPPQPTLLLVHRESGGKVGFHVLNPLTYRLLQRLDEAPELSGRAQLEALAAEAQRGDVDAFVAEGVAMLLQWRGKRIVLGTHAHPSA